MILFLSLSVENINIFLLCEIARLLIGTFSIFSILFSNALLSRMNALIMRFTHTLIINKLLSNLYKIMK